MSWLLKNSSEMEDRNWRMSTLLNAEEIDEDFRTESIGYEYFKDGLLRSKFCGKLRGLKRNIPGIISCNIVFDSTEYYPLTEDVEKCTRVLKRVSVDDVRMKQIAEKLEEMNNVIEQINHIKREADQMEIVDNNKKLHEGLISYLRQCFTKDTVIKKMQKVFERRSSANASCLFTCFNK